MIVELGLGPVCKHYTPNPAPTFQAYTPNMNQTLKCVGCIDTTEVRDMTDVTTREFAHATFRTLRMVAIGLLVYILAQTGILPAGLAQLLLGGVIYDVVKYFAWMYPQAMRAFITADDECDDADPPEKFGREQCVCRRTTDDD